MGVPALFRWLSKKYPRIVVPVVEEDPAKVPSADGEEVEIPINISGPNPNGVEFDNLYLDMNGIVHPCTHPEGKPPPETEEAMMIEIFNYTERIVNMIRPRKLLFMAIDGVAPRAKMNQQRSRRFRSAQEAEDKETTRKEGIAIFEALGKDVADLKKQAAIPPWDSNAITPGTPFMELLASSLRYWIVHKLNTDLGWKDLQIIISDASVPGEGEHKIMDFIRRQRVQPKFNPNTQHCIYGLDADLIMLSLATHEPYFKVLREDVFADDKKNACRICGQEGHYAAQCTGAAKVRQDEHDVQKKPPEKKPFIFLDVSILREYLEIELNVHSALFAFDLERAIDDWVLLIFFVGNDFLPHLPSLEIREGAIDVLLKIWKLEMHRMGGYITNNGHLELSRAQIILQGVATQENDIFRKRREVEQRQDQNAKRRKIEQAARANGGNNNNNNGPPKVMASFSHTSTPEPRPMQHALPVRPSFDSFSASPALPAPRPATPTLSKHPVAAASSPASFAAEGAKALAGSNHDVVANRRAIRMANMSAAEAFKAELAGLAPLKPKAPSSQPQPPGISSPSSVTAPALDDSGGSGATKPSADLDEDIPGFEVSPDEVDMTRVDSELETGDDVAKIEPDEEMMSVSPQVADPPPEESVVAGSKRKIEEVDSADESGIVKLDEEDDAPKELEGNGTKKRIVNADGTVEQEDTVRLWEPGYIERYYREKFGFEHSNKEERDKIVKAYVEGLAWVLQYYYQGTPSWKWFYPYHYAPFAADFDNIDKLDIRFELGQPFKPFEQLMGVFPAASRKHLPEVLQKLMTDEDSPIIDFYPTTFDIDMNGKKMTWQGVALLPFIDEERLLGAMTPLYDQLSPDEQARNKWGSSALYVSKDHPLHPFLEGLYIKRKSKEPVPLDSRLSAGIAGTVLPDPTCIPGATFYCPLPPEKIPDVNPPLSDIYDDGSLSGLYYFPKQHVPHRSVLLNGLRRPARTLLPEDRDRVMRGDSRDQRRGPSYGNHSIHLETGRSGLYNEMPHQAYNNGPGGYDIRPPRHYDGPGSYGGRPNGYGGASGYPNHIGRGQESYRSYGRNGRGY